MKRHLLFPVLAGIFITATLLNCSNTSVSENEKDKLSLNDSAKVKSVIEPKTAGIDESGGKEIIHLTSETFKKEIFDYTKYKDWKYEGKIPAIVDFYADWCRPCKMMEPTLVKLQKEYKGKIQIYKVNTDDNPEVSQAYGITGIPALLFIPMEGEPQMSTGLLPEETLVTTISEVLKVGK